MRPVEKSQEPGPAVEKRRIQILEATCTVMSKQGIAATRVGDVAKHLGISTGLVHYHFDTKDELLAAAFRHAAEKELEALRLLVNTDGTPRELLDIVVDNFFPVSGFPSWRLWIEGWAVALRSESFRRTAMELDEAWVEVLADTLTDGVASGDFACDNPRDSAWRLACLIEGLAIQQVAHGGAINDAETRRLVADAIEAEIG